MPRAARPIAAGAIAFGLVLAARFPARWAAAALPGSVACAHIGGTVWSGTCSGLEAAGTHLGTAQWHLRPWVLFTGKLSLDLAVSPPGGDARARVDLHPGGAIVATAVHARFALGAGLIPALPRSVGGTAAVDLPSIRFDGRRVTALQGRIEVRRITTGRGEPLGSYALLFPTGSGSGNEPVGRLTDLGGPFSVTGTVHLTAEGYVVRGLVAARPGAPPDLTAALRYLGSPDAQGRRPFSFAGTL
ncbi:MAG: type II secretion system protein N [Steroidobacteraceae bacterium]